MIDQETEDKLTKLQDLVIQDLAEMEWRSYIEYNDDDSPKDTPQVYIEAYKEGYWAAFLSAEKAWKEDAMKYRELMKKKEEILTNPLELIVQSEYPVMGKGIVWVIDTKENGITARTITSLQGQLMNRRVCSKYGTGVVTRIEASINLLYPETLNPIVGLIIKKDEQAGGE